MRRKLSKHGNSWAFVIEKPIIELLGFTPETEFEVRTNGVSLFLIPVDAKERSEKFKEAADFLFSNYDEALSKLAE